MLIQYTPHTLNNGKVMNLTCIVDDHDLKWFVVYEVALVLDCKVKSITTLIGKKLKNFQQLCNELQNFPVQSVFHNIRYNTNFLNEKSLYLFIKNMENIKKQKSLKSLKPASSSSLFNHQLEQLHKEIQKLQQENNLLLQKNQILYIILNRIIQKQFVINYLNQQNNFNV